MISAGMPTGDPHLRVANTLHAVPVIVVDDAIAHAQAAFAELGDVHLLPSTAINRETLVRLDAEALVIRSVTRVDAALLDATPRLRFVGAATAGTDHIDLDALAMRGITCASAAGCNAQAVAEWVVAALTVVWDRLPAELTRMPIGVVGFGNVGSRLARLLRALGHEVLACDPPLQQQLASLGGSPEPLLSFEELWQRCAIVSFHVPLIADGPDATLAYVDRHSPTSAGTKLLINTSRGPVIRERALDRPDVGAMILDVWDGEPELAWARLGDPRLWLASPHVAGYSLEAKLAATRMMHEALCAFLGRAPSWSDAELLEPRVLTGPLEGFSSPARVIARVVDLAGDDARVRALVELPPAGRAAAFERLRRDYKLRREFRSWRVPDVDDPDFLAWLRAAGFSSY
jgi:erythronate-4-phosphate dehydrogenase